MLAKRYTCRIILNSGQKTRCMQLSYAKALEELQQLVAQLQEEQTDIDELETRIKRAQELVAFCRQRLRNTEDRIDALFDEDKAVE